MSVAYASRRVHGRRCCRRGSGCVSSRYVRVVHEREVLTGDDADRHAEEVVERGVPTGVASRQVVVDGDQVRAAPLERVEVQRERRDERLALAGLHLGDPSLVEHDPADQLHVEVAHAEGALGRLADHRERLGEEVVESPGALEVALALLGALRTPPPRSPRSGPAAKGWPWLMSVPSTPSRSRNSRVLSRSSSSESADISASRSLMSATTPS